MSSGRRHRVKVVSEAAGVSIRTLHHYDAIGLLVPSGRTEAGYRLYTDDDLLRLQQILIGRELGLALEEIRRILDDPDFDRRQALLRQRAELVGRLERTTRMLHAVDAALAAMQQENKVMDLKQIFDGFDAGQHEPEVKERWGDTDAYRESARRTRGYSIEDWKRCRAENEATMLDVAEAMKAGRRATDAEVMDIAERHRLSIDRWFYPCSKPMHARLADMYEADERFAANIDGHAEGLTPFLSAAIRANAQR
jgi:DNA-binding transcriptional MerR regulator